jgi:hypothetical protein
MIGQIELTDSETALYVQVSEADRRSLVDHDFNRARQAGQAAKELFRSLQRRHSIPEKRLRYFADREYSASDTRTSRRERFLRNAHTEDAMYEHPHFWKYVLYFINGADLPSAIVDRFAELARDSMRDYNTLSSFARRASRQLPGDHGTKADEFFKLAIDCDCPLTEAIGVRRAVMQAR